MMDALAELIRWAKEEGVELAGIKPKRIAGRGCGIVATRRIREGDVILTVPTRALRTMATVPKSISRKVSRDMSVHGVLAADLALDATEQFAPWNAVLPTADDLEAGMPALWPRALQALLPAPAREVLARQQAKFRRDWDVARAAFPGEVEAGRLTREAYLLGWLLVNSRTFYYTTPRTEELPHDDRLAMQPVADLFNHADAGCKVSFSPDGFSVAADRAYRAGEEVHICYGSHSNDFLLVEYGFVMAAGENRWDEVCLDEVVLPRLGRRHRAELEDRGFLGGYMLDAQTAGCHRTQVALRLLLTTTNAAYSHRRWLAFVDGEDDGEAAQADVDALLADLLRRFLDGVIRPALEAVEGLTAGLESQRELLALRWGQMEAMVAATISRLGG